MPWRGARNVPGGPRASAAENEDDDDDDDDGNAIVITGRLYSITQQRKFLQRLFIEQDAWVLEHLSPAPGDH